MVKFINAEYFLTNYKSIILDIWGVIHNGEILLPGVKDFINILNHNNIDYYFLSNAPRPHHLILEKLVSMELDIKKDIIVTSGDFFLNSLDASSNTKNFKGKAFIIGSEKNTDLLQDIKIDTTSKMQDADYIIMLGHADSKEEIKYYNLELDKAIKFSLPMLCSNPDKIADNGSSQRYCQGYFASSYERIGGKVTYFGKPHKEIYEFLFSKYNIDKSKALMIGDSMQTDIKGASDFGFHSALVMTGIHKKETNISSFLKNYEYHPTYLLQNLVC